MSNITYSASIMRVEQLKIVLKYAIERVYIPFDLFYWGNLSVSDIELIHDNSDIQVYITLPRIIRKKDELYLEKLKDFLLLGKADGLLLRNLESIGFVNSISTDLESQYISLNGAIPGYTSLMVETDSSLYNWNQSSLAFNKNYSVRQTAPVELSIHELKELEDRDIVIPAYGRAVLMITANCVKKTSGNCMADCTHGSFEWSLKDRKGKSSLVYANCIHCYNEIYNSIPTSLHRQAYDLIKNGFNDFRLDFTCESSKEVMDIMNYYLVDMRNGSWPGNEYTAAHITKGVQ